MQYNLALRKLAARIILSVTAFLISDNAHAQADVKARFGAWEFRCKASSRPEGQTCALTQAMQSEDDPGSTVGVIIRKTPSDKNGIFQIIAPEGVILPEGVKFKIDESEIGQLMFFKCFPAGCVAEGIINDSLLEKLKAGRVVVLITYMNPDQGLRHLFSLDGFQEGYRALN